MENKSMLTVAYQILKDSSSPIEFTKLVEMVANELGIDQETIKNKIAQFYTNLSLDGRFVVLSDNYWELRERVPFERVHIDMNDAYIDADEDDEIEDKERELGENDSSDSDFESDEEESDKDSEELGQ
jgi:DNA-directed RNA polymerase subunit delta